MEELLHALQNLFLTDIPITRHLGVTIAAYDDGCLTLRVPLAENSNHHETAFAGSINAALTLAGWGLLWLLLKESHHEAQIVIQNSAIKYLRPVTRDFKVRCCKPEPAQIAKLLNTLSKRGRARLELSAEIHEYGQVAVSFKGRYVAHLQQP